MLDASAVTSAGLLYTLFHWSEISRTEARSEHCLGYLKKISINSLSLLSSSGGGRCYLENNETINFDGAGVCNLFENLHWCHGSIRDSFASAWSEMRENGKLMTEMTSASIIDVVFFVALVRRHRRQLKRHVWSARTTNVWCQCMWSLVKFLAAFVNYHCRLLERSVPDIADRAIPSRKKLTADRSHGLETFLNMLSFLVLGHDMSC